MIVKLFILISLVYMTGFCYIPASASGILVAPARIEVGVEDDCTLPFVHIYNRTDRYWEVTSAIRWGRHDIYGNPSYVKHADKTVNITVRPSTQIIAPKESTYVEVITKLCDEPMYPVLILEFNNPEQRFESVHVTQIAVPFLISPKEHPGPSTDFDIQLEEDEDGLSYTLSVLVINTADVHKRIKGKLLIVKPPDEKVQKKELGLRYVLPDSKRLFTMQLKRSDLKPGDYKVFMATEEDYIEVGGFNVDGGGRMQVLDPVDVE